MTELPVDPKGLGIDTGYYYYSNGVDFKLLAFQTIESNCPVPASDFMYDPVRNPATAWGPKVPCTYAIYSPGARNWQEIKGPILLILTDTFAFFNMALFENIQTSQFKL